MAFPCSWNFFALVLSCWTALAPFAAPRRPPPYAFVLNPHCNPLLQRSQQGAVISLPLTTARSSSFIETQSLPTGQRKMLRSMMRLAATKGPVQTAMERKLRERLAPVFLEVTNESGAHKGHAGNPFPHLDETHFTVKIRSEEFKGKSLVQQHRLIYEVLKQELRGGVHALSIYSDEPVPEDKQ
ncbi:transcriptional regulator related protein [Cyclospora cayetanensis]|uniref:Transcriptional regulator related protein n=1 Tax=Cyclospora cayetanensis TaxID=88456 RepID=A0A1D3CRU5_9EIME|nr:transcriptional regulator related protein [Cyclospora cayetanensis]